MAAQHYKTLLKDIQLHSLMLVLLNGGTAAACRNSEKPAVALADVGVTEWRTASDSVQEWRVRCVALADVGVTEWRSKEFHSFFHPLLPLHSLMLVLLNGGLRTNTCRLPFSGCTR